MGQASLQFDFFRLWIRSLRNLNLFFSLSFSALASHMGRHHNPAGREKKFPCDMCEKTFFEPNHLQRHKRFVHLKERNFHCEECGNSFRDSFAVILNFQSFLSPIFCQYVNFLDLDISLFIRNCDIIRTY